MRTAAGEIDLIARRGAVLVFVEVKSARMLRADGSKVAPEPRPLESLRHRQRVRIRRAAAVWLRGRGGELSSLPGRPATIRFDAIGVVLDCRWDLHRLDHVEGAW